MTRLAIVEWPGGDPPFILLHGLGGNALSWGPLAECLSERHLIAFDLPAHGQSPPPASWKIEDLARDLMDAVCSRELPDPVWVGHSWGGKLALAAAVMAAPARGLVLIEPVYPRRTSASAERTVDELLSPELREWPDFAAAKRDVQSLPQYTPWSAAIEQAFLRGLETEPDGSVRSRLTPESAIDALRAAFETDLSAAAARLACPVLTLTASTQSSANEPLFRHATARAIPGNHWLHIHQTDAVASAVEDWLTTAPFTHTDRTRSSSSN